MFLKLICSIYFCPIAALNRFALILSNFWALPIQNIFAFINVFFVSPIIVVVLQSLLSQLDFWLTSSCQVIWLILYTCRLILLSKWMWSQRYKWIWLNIPCAVLLTCHWGCVSLLDHIVCLSSTYLNLSIFLWFRPGNFKNSHFIPFNLEVLQSITLIIIRLATIVSLFNTLLTDSIFLTSYIT